MNDFKLNREKMSLNIRVLNDGQLEAMVKNDKLFDDMVNIFCTGYDESIYNTFGIPNPYDKEKESVEWCVWMLGHSVGAGQVSRILKDMVDNF